MHQALLLDSSYYPLQMIGWKKAITLSFTGRAEIVEHHQDIIIRSPNLDVKLPKVIRLFCKLGNINAVKFNRLNVLYRDNFTCQYCNVKFRPSELTMDHVIPRSKGGGTNWENIVAACACCNGKKADHLPHDCNMHPLKKPRKPAWLSLFILKMSYNEKEVWKEWFSF
jgi:5-methylcytosine-specific restriction endonuclease McrA